MKTEHKLIIVEGLPCSGKSTTSKYIADTLGMRYYDEGTGCHPADYEFHAYLKAYELDGFSDSDRALIESRAERLSRGYVVPLAGFEGELFDKLLTHKIYDFLPWHVERPVMLDKWLDFRFKALKEDTGYVFNSVLLQNPMCETMIRFDLPGGEQQRFIHDIRNIIAVLDPFIVYLRCGDIRARIERAIPERGEQWLNAVIEYHCGGEYGRARYLKGFDGYISALNDRQAAELYILKRGMDLDYMVLDDPDEDWDGAYERIISRITCSDSVFKA